MRREFWTAVDDAMADTRELWQFQFRQFFRDGFCGVGLVREGARFFFDRLAVGVLQPDFSFAAGDAFDFAAVGRAGIGNGGRGLHGYTVIGRYAGRSKPRPYRRSRRRRVWIG